MFPCLEISIPPQMAFTPYGNTSPVLLVSSLKMLKELDLVSSVYVFLFGLRFVLSSIK